MDDQTTRAAMVGAGVAALPFVWKGFCKLLYLAMFFAGRLAGKLSAHKQA